MDSNATAAKETIERVTQAIFEVLYHQGDMDLQHLKEKVDAPVDVFDMASALWLRKMMCSYFLQLTPSSFTGPIRLPLYFPFEAIELEW